MAQAAATEDEPLNQDLNCPICLELLNEPVTLHACFHSFCKRCLEQTINGARESYRNPYSCPQCRRGFSPSELQRVNQHLQSIVESHRMGQERRAEVRQTEDSRTFTNEIDRLNTVLTTAEVFVESLVNALDHATRRSGRRHQRVRLGYVDSFEDTYEDTVPLLPQVVVQDHPPDCEFEAETLQEFRHRSMALCRRHFILIMFIIHASIFVVCLFKAMM